MYENNKTSEPNGNCVFLTGYDNTSGPLCYDCAYEVDRPEYCDKIKRCSRDQVSIVDLWKLRKYQSIMLIVCNNVNQ